MNKKGIGPVVAVALLLVVAVVAVVGFQTWFQTYSSSLYTKAESQDLSDISGVENVVGDELFFKNDGNENISIDKVKVGDNDCNINTNVSSGVQSINLGSCVENLSGSNEVVVYSDDEIFSKDVFIYGESSKGSDEESFSLDCSTLSNGNWSAVPGNSELGTEDFCVMKYEAKNVSEVPHSRPSDTPWVSINQTDARQACSNLGAGYELITDAQWVTMARNAENIGANWNSSTVGQGSMWRGHTDNSPDNALSVSDTFNYYDQTGNSNPSIQRRVLELSTGDVVWDIGGNVFEMTNDTIYNATLEKSDDVHEWTNIQGYDDLKPNNSTFNSSNGIGKVETDTSTNRALQRGGMWFSDTEAGAFGLGLNYPPRFRLTFVGFRCSYTG